VDLPVIATVVLAIAVGVISPGPTFIVVARTALSTTPRLGRITAVGVGTASLVFSVLAAAGVSAVLAYLGRLFAVLKVAGGVYLVVLAVRMWRSHATAAVPEQAGGVRRAYLTGLVTQLSNPKTIVIYGSVFVALLPSHAAVGTLVALPIATTTVEVLWYTLVATTLSRPRPQRLYLGWSRVIDRIAGTFLGALGAWFAVDGLREVLR
jgi:threonine/homoserine/homoserine lactone efflux protein